MASKMLIKSKCSQCGVFTVIRPRRKYADSMGVVRYYPQQVVCPSCHMWGETISATEIKEGKKK